MLTRMRFLFAVIAICFGTALIGAQQPSGDKSGERAGEKGAEKPKDEKKLPEDKSVTTKHSLRIGGQEVKYTATAGTIVLKLEDGTPKASIFYVAYTKDDAGDAAKRPITFAFNGGPGAGSAVVRGCARGAAAGWVGEVGDLGSHRAQI